MSPEVEQLIQQLKTIPDWRRGKRPVQYPLWLMLLLTLLGVMSGYTSLRGLADFMARHQQAVAQLFGLSQAKLPSYSTLRDMVQHVDPTALAQVFHAWAKQAVPLEAGQVLSWDGKALASTVTDCHGNQQNFVSVVSACVQPWAGVVGQMSYHNGQSSEITTLRQLLEQLELSGLWNTLDALHCQKNS